MGRLLETWRSMSLRQQALVGASATLLAIGGAVGGYFLLKRPADVVNPEVTFQARETKTKERERTSNWPVYGLNRARTRYLPAKGLKPPFRQLWHFDAGQLLEFSPILVGRTIYVMNNDARVFALNSQTGKVKWRNRVGKLSAASPAFAQGRIFLTTLDPGQAVALNTKNGKVEWRRELPGRSESQPVVEGGKVYFGDESGNVWALAARTGKVAWRTPTAGNVKAGPAFRNGTLYVGDYAGTMYAIRAKDGAVRWEASDQGSGFGQSGRFYSTPALAFGRVYAGNADGRVYSFDQRTGELAWSQSLGRYVYAAPVVADPPGMDPTVFVGTNSGDAFALDARNGSEIWSTGVGGEISGAGTVVGDIFYVADVDSEKTVGLDIKSGKRVWGIDRGKYNPVISDGQRMYLTGYASIAALEPKRRGSKSNRSQGKQNRNGSGGG